MVCTSRVFLGAQALNTSSSDSANFGVFQHVCEKLILAPFERNIDVAENAQERAGLMLGERAKYGQAAHHWRSRRSAARSRRRAWNEQA